MHASLGKDPDALLIILDSRCLRILHKTQSLDLLWLGPMPIPGWYFIVNCRAFVLGDCGESLEGRNKVPDKRHLLLECCHCLRTTQARRFAITFN